MKNRHTKLAMVLVTSLGLLACGKDEARTKNTSEAKAKAAENAPNATAPTPAAEKPKEQVSAKGAHFALGMMTAYEQCRTELANDKTDGIADCATKFVEASKNAHANAPEAAHEHITAAATAADALASAKLDDIAAVRLAFGELSKPIVAMLTAAPDVAKDYHVFECPMAKGYKRWAQPDGDLKNPYMGQGMLACGSEVHDHHTANQDGAEGHAGHAH